MEFFRTFVPAFVFCLTLMGCQTVGIDQDPSRSTKIVLASAGLMVDAIGVYGHLPPCDGTAQPLGCRNAVAYRDMKLIASSTATGFQSIREGSTSSILLSAALIYAQYELAKTVAVTPGPTDPNAPPSPTTVAYIQSIGLADLLVNSADDRIKAASGPNVTVAELLAELQAKVAALP